MVPVAIVEMQRKGKYRPRPKKDAESLRPRAMGPENPPQGETGLGIVRVTNASSMLAANSKGRAAAGIWFGI